MHLPTERKKSNHAAVNKKKQPIQPKTTAPILSNRDSSMKAHTPILSHEDSSLKAPTPILSHEDSSVKASASIHSHEDSSLKAPTLILSHEDSLPSKSLAGFSHQDSISVQSNNVNHRTDEAPVDHIVHDITLHSSDEGKQAEIERPLSSHISSRYLSPLLNEGPQEDSILSLELNDMQDLMPGDRNTLSIRGRGGGK